jgi:hypothetical protein
VEEKQLCGPKIETNFWNFFFQAFYEENMLSILFAGTGIVCFESLSQNAAANNFKKCQNKTTFEVWTNHFV